MSVFTKIVKKVLQFADSVGGGLSQTSTDAKADTTPFENMPQLGRKVAAEGAVLLRNDNVLPFKANEKLSVFGRCQSDWFFVGYGSGGDVNPPYKSGLLQAIRESDRLQLNEELANVYARWIEKNPADDGFWGHWPRSHPEMPLTRELVERAAAQSDAAVVVIGRSSGEDRENVAEEGSWYLTDSEKTMLQYVTDAFSKTVVLLNTGSMMDLRWTTRGYDNQVAVLCVWQGGMESGNAIADLLCGRMNPCGKLPDTAAVLGDYPSAASFGNKDYNNYTEDIFVGYRWFETFAKEKVLYPFGFGLSYTSFRIALQDAKKDDSNVCLSFDVKNTGDSFAGKEVVQVYVQAPQGKLGKPLRSLCGFAKTGILQPGEQETAAVAFSLYTLASFDDSGVTGNKNAWIAEQGEYVFYAGNDVRNAQKVWSFTLDEDIVFERVQEAAAPAESFLRTVAVQSDDGLMAAKQPVPVAKRDLKARILQNLPQAVSMCGDKGIRLQDVADKTHTLQEFVSQLNLTELEAISRGDYVMNSPLGASGNAGVLGGVLPSLREKGVPPVTCTDGPSGIRLNTISTLLPIGALLASTWDTELCRSLYEAQGKEMVKVGSDMLLGPGMNIHRSPLCGRNFEYFSEDPLLTGKMGAAVVQGIQTYGFSACPKHFACNNQETNRNRNDSRVSQRALREIYLKGFEICVKEAKPLTIMTSYNKINGVWAHYHYDLCNVILRQEWGYDGLVITDWWMRSSASPEFPQLRDNAYRVRAGVDVLMPGGNRTGARRPDGTLLKTYGKENGISLGELQFTAENVLHLCLKKIRHAGKETE